ncbi:hypothetical protein WAI453_004259 [Rhynchosporium graminicola]|uniref:Uncharacterized protein n=1 Tax=Rhynchosporium graminicola TaxID=2792576 RepID=A0A1E1JX11_9HELO|nr:uncharacterized protein RCO7_08617 [Rhynchosporium commune]
MPSDAVQTLSAAFAFGILLQAAAGALFIYYRGHGSTIFQDGRRLVLILFLLFAALWAQVSFLNLLLPDTMATACQATLIISTMFDQLARVGVEQFLLWSVGHGTKVTAERMIQQGILLVRMVGGAVLVGFTRPQFAPVCVARTSITPLAVGVLALDAIIIGVLLVRAASLGMFKEMRDKEAGTRQEQSKALIISIIVLGLWTASSVPMILGNPSFNLMVRTSVPANGLLVMVAVVTMFPGALLLVREQNATTPEARSPFVAPMPPMPPMPPREVFEDTARSNGSPVSNRTYTRDVSLFVVNPSNTPQESPNIFRRSPRGDTRGFTRLGNEIDARDISDTPPERPERPGGRGPGYRGSSGVFPSMIGHSQTGLQGALAPQIRSDYPLPSENAAEAFQFPAVQQKRSMFGWSKPAPAKPSIRTLAISKPIALDVSGGLPQQFPKMQTIDLATAASMERERREEAQARARLVANKPAPQPPQLSTQEAFRRSVSIVRKEMPTLPAESMPMVPATSVAGQSRVAVNGTTSSASLSPGHEEVRRRSPRQTNTFDQKFNERTTPLPTLHGKQTNSFDQTFSPNPPPPPPTLRRNPTVGLPSNPRSTKMMITQETAEINAQTAMLMKDVVYDNPAPVQNIMRDAPGIYAAAQKTRDSEMSMRPEAVTSRSSNSVIHRPRPYKREKGEDRVLFPSMPSPSHRRSRSSGSIMPRRLLMSEPGSPSLLPQVPPLPPPTITSAANLKRLLPNDTKSMTFNEKIEMLFPAPPGPTANRSRRSSVPSLSRVSSVLTSETPMLQSPSLDEEQNRRASKRATVASFAIPEISVESAKRQSRPDAYRFSPNTYRNLADEVGETWIPETPTEQFNNRDSDESDSQRESIMYDQRKSFSTDVSEESPRDDDTTYWGSGHLNAPPADLSRAGQQANSMYMQQPESREPRNSMPFGPSNPLPDDLRRCEAFVPLILDAKAHRLSFFGAEEPRRSFILDPNQSLSGNEMSPPLKVENGWHHRIGDELPTFSERTHLKGRKMPPPTPLNLSKTGKRATVVIFSSEPSSPVDYPERAIAELQAQLKRFEEGLNRDSLGSVLRHMPEDQPEGAPDTGRFQLLENLEKEMGQQENHWQQMHTNLDRNSVSEAMSTFTQVESEDSEASPSPVYSQISIRTPVRLTRTRTPNRTSMAMFDRNTTVSSSDNSRASIWQRRLAEAQMEYMLKSPALLKNKSTNFLAISRNKSPMMSPTPPESVESETDIETELDSDSDTEAMMKYQAPVYQAPPSKKIKAELWQSSLPSPKAASGRMWNPPYETASTSSGVEPPARGIRPTQRRMENSLSILSTQLWVKPRSSEHSRPVVGMWGSKLVRPRSISTRPVTQRPQRKSKRMSFLPDIVESPIPLPNKRDTLGLYQFPWGETSDQPTYQSGFNPVIIGGDQPISFKPDARSKKLEPEQSEYSSSFFDDCEEENENLDGESDDEFDESTLWEIANLLKSTDVPSRDSLFFEPSALIEDYDLDFETNSPTAAAPSPVSRISIEPLAMSSRPMEQLWGGDSCSSLEGTGAGLPQSESHAWDALIAAKTDLGSSKSRSSSAVPAVSGDLWAATQAVSTPTQGSFMWSSVAAADIRLACNSTLGITASALMWSPKTEVAETRRSGMFTIPSEVIRSTTATPAAFEMVKAVRPSVGKILSISSRHLWTRMQNMEESTSWLSISSVPRVGQQQSASTTMWTPSLKKPESLISGLFDVAIQRSNFRSCEASPAALKLVRKPRSSLAPLSTLSSSELWRSGQDNFPIERDWISESSTRPDSPTYSTISSGTSSPTSDSSSVKSASTKASSVWSSPFAAIPSWWDVKSKKSPVAAPRDDFNHLAKLPVRQAPTPLVAVRESRVLASRDLWEARAPVLENTPAKVFRRGTPAQPSAISVVKARPSQSRRPVTSRADWDNALAQAIVASSVTKVLFRPTSTQADWESALSEAISQSKIPLQRPEYSLARWETALAEAVTADIMKSSHDAAILHPGFFTKSLISNVSDIHPAAIGHFVYKTAQPSMWKSASAIVTPKAAVLWSKENVTPRMAVSSTFSSEISRTAAVSRTTSISVLESTSFLTPSRTAPKEKNWLLSTTTVKKTSTPAAQTWTPIIGAPVFQQNNTAEAAMWNSLSASAQSTPDIFSKAEGSYIKQVLSTRPVGLAQLESNELFASAQVTPQSAKHWLHETSAPYLPSKPLTWTTSANSTPATEQRGMWQSSRAITTSPVPLFTNPHSEPWSRNKRIIEAVIDSETKSDAMGMSMWRPSRDYPSSPKNWLVERRVSKVVFRY